MLQAPEMNKLGLKSDQTRQQLVLNLLRLKSDQTRQQLVLNLL